MRYVLTVVLAAMLVGGTGCSTSEPATPNPFDAHEPGVFPSPAGAEALKDVVSGTGTIRYVQLEGGFYGIESDDGKRYDPTNLEEAFREDGLRVRFRGMRLHDVATTHMWGTPLKVQEMKRL